MRIAICLLCLEFVCATATAQSEAEEGLARGNEITQEQLPPLSMCMSSDGLARLLQQHPGARVTHVSEPARELFYGEQMHQVYPLNKQDEPATNDQVVVGFTCASRYAASSAWLGCFQFGAICNGNIRFQPYNTKTQGLPVITWTNFDSRASARYPGSGAYGRVAWYTVKGNPYPVRADSKASAASR
jgi:hypothetical protein